MSLPATNGPVGRMTFLAPGNIYFAKCAMLLQVETGLEQRWCGVSDDRLDAIVERHEKLMSSEARLPRRKDPPAATLAGTVARLAIALQRSSGLDVAGWKEVPGQERLAIFACADQAVGQAAAALALHTVAGGSETERESLLRQLADAATPLLQPLVRAAALRGIPYAVALRGDKPFTALGQGQKRRLFWRNFTSATSHLATTLSNRKDLTAKLLRDAGLPAPRNVVVRDVATAMRAADALGYPVVVKPVAADYGRGVTTGVPDAERVRDAFVRAAEYGAVLVEEQVAGDHYRLLVMHGRCVAVSRRLPAHVVGDGVSTISELVEAINLRRTERLGSAGVKIKLDEVGLEFLRRKALTPSSVPAAGKVVVLRGNANQSAGGTVEMMTEVTHSEVLRLAVQAAGLFGIDVAGIDYLTSDITRSPAETGGAICEVNVTPGFVNQGDTVALTCELLAPFFAPGNDGRIPTVCLLGPAGSHGAFAQGLVALLDGDVARADEVRFWSARTGGSPPPLTRRVAAVLANPLAAAALIPCTPEEIVRSGLGLDVCSLAVLTPGVTGEAVAGLLRVSQDAVVPASVAAAMPEVLAATACRTWIVGEPPPSVADRCTGWVRRIGADVAEVCTADGAAWRISESAASDAGATLIAAGTALGLPATRIVELLRSLQFDHTRA